MVLLPSIRKALLATILSLVAVTSHAQRLDTLSEKRKINKILLTESAVYFAELSYLQYIWYKDSKRVPFHFYNDNAGYLQVDKFGHAYGAYKESYIGYRLLRNEGISKKKALIYGGPLGLLLQAPIEVFDGLYEDWGFSWGDMAANTFGAALVVGQEIAFDDQIVKYKFSFTRSTYADNSNGYLGNNYLESFVYDYNGHSYWFSANANRLFMKNKLPDWLNIAVGYSANGMLGEFKNKTYYRGQYLPEYTRYRQFLLAPDIDLTKIKTNSKFLKGFFRTFALIKIPMPTLEYNPLDGFKGHWLYF